MQDDVGRKARLQFADDEPSGKSTKAAPHKAKPMALPHIADNPVEKALPRLKFGEQAKPPSKLLHEALPSPAGEIHKQIDEAEEENVGLRAAHSTEKAAESSMRFVENSIRAKSLRTQRAAEKVELRTDRTNIRQLQKKEQLSSNPYSRWQQKRAIKKQYMTAKAAGNTVALRNGTSLARSSAAKKVLKNKKTFALGILLFLLLAMVLNGLSACTPLIEAGMQAIVIATYPAEDSDIRAAERAYQQMEADLQHELDNYAQFHPGYDEYQFELDEIWHDPHALIALISARVGDSWTIDDVQGILQLLFDKQYTLSQTVKSETRYRKEWVTKQYKETDPETGEVKWVSYDVLEDVAYTHRICTVVLDNFNLSHLPFYVLSREGVGRYAMYMSVLGNREDIFRGYRHASILKEPTLYDVPEELLEDETFARIITEANRYIGYPYVWGGDSPETSFDCSGFVSYVFTNSGVRNVGRLGATSLYGACRKITPEEAKPGDLIFFEGTIPGEDGITHCGIYVGDNWMIHCGSPLGYAYLDDSYHREHFYAFGRLTN